MAILSLPTVRGDVPGRGRLARSHRASDARPSAALERGLSACAFSDRPALGLSIPDDRRGLCPGVVDDLGRRPVRLDHALLEQVVQAGEREPAAHRVEVVPHVVGVDAEEPTPEASLADVLRE